MNEEPATSVEESTSLRFSFVTFSAGLHVLDSHLTWGQQVHTGNGAGADGVLTLERPDIQPR